MFKPNNSKYWHYSIMIDGKIVRGSTRTTNKQLAAQIEAKKRNELAELVKLNGTQPISLYKAVELYLDSRKKFSNYKLHKSILNKMVKLVPNKNIHEITTQDIGKWHLARKRENIEPATLRNDIVAFRAVVRYAKEYGYSINGNLEYPKTPPVKSRVRFLSQQQQSALLDYLANKQTRNKRGEQRKKDAYDIAFVLLRTGARYSEIANIRWEDIDFTNNVIHLYRPKVKNESVLFMDEQTKQLLTRRWANRESEQWVFTNEKADGPRSYCRTLLREALDEIGCQDMNIHTLRHSYASNLAQNGFTLQEIGQMLGHAHITTTMVYSHLVHTDVAKKVKEFHDNRDKAELNAPVCISGSKCRK